MNATGSSGGASLCDGATLMAEVEQNRLNQSDEEFLNYCIDLCRTGRLTTGKLRATVWRDILLGRGETVPVPQLGEGIVRQFQEEVRAQASQIDDAHSRVSTGLADSFGSLRSQPTPCAVEVVSSSITHNRIASDTLSHTPPKGSDLPIGSILCSSQRRRNHSVEHPPRTSPTSQHVDAVGDFAAQPQRRAHSQLSRRVKSEAVWAGQLGRSDAADMSASSSTDLSSSQRRPMAWYHLPDNCQPRVVEADVERSLWKLYPKTEERNARRIVLKNTILRMLLNHPDRYYYQGLHELIGFVLYLLSPHLDSETAVAVCDALLTTRWRKYSARRLKNSEAMLYAIHAVIAQDDPPLAAALEWCGVGPESHYAVSWVITWFVHSIDKVEVLARLFDFFVADSTGAAIIYVTAAFVMQQRDTIFEWVHEAKEETGVDGHAVRGGDENVVLMARVYAQLSRLPGNTLASMDRAQVDALIEQAEYLCEQYADTVATEEANFLHDDVKKLGMLSNSSTRNAALRLLWRFLPREWRTPAKAERVRRFVFWTSLMVAATAVVVGTAAVDAKQGRWMGHMFH